MRHVAVSLWFICNAFLVNKCEVQGVHNITELEKLWNDYKKRFEKNYNGHINNRRKSAWLDNREKIEKHNEEAKKGVHNYTLSENHLADMTRRHYHRTMIKLVHSHRRDVRNPEEVGGPRLDYENVPREIDWREKGFVTPQNNQRNCGSCYAFSIALSIQAQIFKQTNILEPLSEQQIVDCSSMLGNHGCGGGSLRNTLKYLDRAGGLMAARDYPYTAKQTICKFSKEKVIVNLTSWAIIPPRDERAIEAVVGTIGPVAASINASPHTFQFYKSGVYDDPACSSNVVNHAMLIVGYTEDAWILKNWWGEKWGENGYMKIRKNKNLCGISNYVAYVLV